MHGANFRAVPELPETETIARDLAREVVGLRIDGVHVRRRDVLREATSVQFARRVTGAAIDRCWRRAKLVVMSLSNGEHIVVQPRFTGALLLDDGSLPAEERRYSTIEFRLADTRRLHYRDVRRLGTVTVMSSARFDAYASALGIEPLDPSFTATHLSALLRNRRPPIKKTLMDQRIVAGIGNIYANESLWRAGIDPSRSSASIRPAEAESLRREIVAVLRESIAARGTSFRDYRDANGARGGFVEHLAAYGRGGEPCRRCGARLVETHAIDGRTTVLCARCQH